MTEALGSGILLVDKPWGLSSHGGVSAVRRALSTKRVGHAGTLDPQATGLLVLGVGQGTRFLTFVVGLDKAYTATLRLGYETTTDDAEGERVDVPGSGVGSLHDEEILGSLASFRGRIEQVPSSFSAIKVEGKRAYDLARSGETPQLKSRSVTISRLEGFVLDRSEEHIDVRLEVECSSGTYIRALARDIGRVLGVGGHLTSLRRTRVGPFHCEGAVKPEAVVAADLMTLTDAARAVMPLVDVSARESDDLSHGRPILLRDFSEGVPLAAVNAESGGLVAVIEAHQGRSRILMGVSENAS